MSERLKAKVEQVPVNDDSTLAGISLGALGADPLVSVIISNFNYVDHLPAAVQSVKDQTYSNVEIVICDDGSTDESETELKKFEASDSRVAVIRKENGGQASAWNAAVEHSRGEILCLLDPDDRFMPDKIERVVAAFRQNPQAGVCVHPVLPHDVARDLPGLLSPRILEGGWLASRAIERGGWGNWVPSSGLAFRREIAARIFPLPPEVGFWGDAFIQSSGQFLTQFVAVADALTRYLIHERNTVGWTQPTVKSMTRMVQSYEIVFACLTQWMERHFPDQVSYLNIYDNSQYIEHLLVLGLLQGNHGSGVWEHSPEDLLTRLPPTRRRLIWTALYWMPESAARHAVIYWWSMNPWKRRIHTFLYLVRKRLASRDVPEGRVAELTSIATATLGPLSDEPLVSIIMANHNYGSYIGRAIESVLNQSWQNLELVICDDGSTDDSLDSIRRYQSQDDRVKLIAHDVAQGQGVAFNSAYQKCRGEIICILDSDDTYFPEKIERITRHFQNHPTIGLLSHSGNMIDADDRFLCGMPFRTRLEHGWMGERVLERGGRWSHMPGGGTCIRREVARYLFPVPADVHRMYADGYLYTLGALLTEISSIPEPLYNYRIHGRNALQRTLRDEKVSQQQLLALRVESSATNRRLRELNIRGFDLDLNRNLNYLQHLFLLNSFHGLRRLRLSRQWLYIARMLIADDLYHRSERLARIVIYGLSLPLPVRMRTAFLLASRSPRRFLLSLRDRAPWRQTAD